MDPKDQFPEHDHALREWFAARGWAVTECFRYCDSEIYAWRHRGSEGCYTLYVDREVLDRNEARTLPRLLDHRSAEAALRDVPGGEALLSYGPQLLVLRYFERGD